MTHMLSSFTVDTNLCDEGIPPEKAEIALRDLANAVRGESCIGIAWPKLSESALCEYLDYLASDEWASDPERNHVAADAAILACIGSPRVVEKFARLTRYYA